MLALTVDTSQAGQGELRLEVRGQMTTPDASVQPAGSGRYEVTFMPQEGARHYVSVHFNDEAVRGELAFAGILGILSGVHEPKINLHRVSV